MDEESSSSNNSNNDNDTPPKKAGYFEPLPFDGFPDKTLSRVFHVFRERWRGFLCISLLVYLSGWICAIFTNLVLDGNMLVDGYSVRIRLNYYTFSQQNLWILFCFLLECAIYYSFACVANAASIWLVVHLYLDSRPTINDAFHHVFQQRLFWNLIGSLLLAAIITLLPVLLLFALAILILPNSAIFFTIVCIVTWCYLMYSQIIFYQIYPIVTVEKQKKENNNTNIFTPIITTLQRSYELSYDRLFYIFTVLVLWFVIKTILTLPISLLRQANINEMTGRIQRNTFLYFVSNSLDTILGILYMTFDSIFQGVVYLQNRIAKEELSREILANELGIDDLDNIITEKKKNENRSPTNSVLRDWTQQQHDHNSSTTNKATKQLQNNNNNKEDNAITISEGYVVMTNNDDNKTYIPLPPKEKKKENNNINDEDYHCMP